MPRRRRHFMIATPLRRYGFYYDALIADSGLIRRRRCATLYACFTRMRVAAATPPPLMPYMVDAFARHTPF